MPVSGDLRSFLIHLSLVSALAFAWREDTWLSLVKPLLKYSTAKPDLVEHMIPRREKLSIYKIPPKDLNMAFITVLVGASPAEDCLFVMSGGLAPLLAPCFDTRALALGPAIESSGSGWL